MSTVLKSVYESDYDMYHARRMREGASLIRVLDEIAEAVTYRFARACAMREEGGGEEWESKQEDAAYRIEAFIDWADKRHNCGRFASAIVQLFLHLWEAHYRDGKEIEGALDASLIAKSE